MRTYKIKNQSDKIYAINNEIDIILKRNSREKKYFITNSAGAIFVDRINIIIRNYKRKKE